MRLAPFGVACADPVTFVCPNRPPKCDTASVPFTASRSASISEMVVTVGPPLAIRRLSSTTRNAPCRAWSAARLILGPPANAAVGDAPGVGGGAPTGTGGTGNNHFPAAVRRTEITSPSKSTRSIVGVRPGNNDNTLGATCNLASATPGAADESLPPTRICFASSAGAGNTDTDSAPICTGCPNADDIVAAIFVRTASDSSARSPTNSNTRNTPTTMLAPTKRCCRRMRFTPCSSVQKKQGGSKTRPYSYHVIIPRAIPLFAFRPSRDRLQRWQRRER